ncbi:MAG: hypothetical protein JO113_08550 [Candidatus Eremiobacteraeota bacterium]|nr:hypothetical protein [Candidatus Eremiobacteraeota bacterium]
MMRLRLAALAAAAIVAACSNSSRGSTAGPSPQATDPIAFPLFGGAAILSARSWRTTISKRPGMGDSTVLAEGAGTYDGHDVVAGTQAYMPALESWLQSLAADPPPGYEVAITGNGVEAVRSHTRELGVDFVAFDNQEQGKRHGVVVMVVDPQTLDEKAGPMLGLIGRFKHVPSVLRDPIDAQAKKQTGFSITEATNPDTPIGAAVAALDELRDFGGRGIVLIDAVKQ